MKKMTVPKVHRWMFRYHHFGASENICSVQFSPCSNSSADTLFSKCVSLLVSCVCFVGRWIFSTSTWDDVGLFEFRQNRKLYCCSLVCLPSLGPPMMCKAWFFADWLAVDLVCDETVNCPVACQCVERCSWISQTHSEVTSSCICTLPFLFVYQTLIQVARLMVKIIQTNQKQKVTSLCIWWNRISLITTLCWRNGSSILVPLTNGKWCTWKLFLCLLTGSSFACLVSFSLGSLVFTKCRVAFSIKLFCLGEKQGMLVNSECSSWYNRAGDF